MRRGDRPNGVARRRATSRGRVAACSLLAILVLGGPGARQVDAQADDPPAAPPIPDADAPTTTLTPELIRERIAALKALETVSDDQAAQLAALEAAIGFLSRLETATANTEASNQTVATAPERLAQVKVKLAEPDTLNEAPLPETLEAVEAELQALRPTLEQAQRRVAELEERRTTRQNRRQAMPTELAAITKRLEALSVPTAETAVEASIELLTARRTATNAERSYLRQQQLALEAELKSYEATTELLREQIRLANRTVTTTGRRITALEDVRNRLQRASARKEVEKAEQALSETAEAQQDPLLIEAAETIKSLAQERVRITEQQDRQDHRKVEVRQLLERWTVEFESMQRQVEAFGTDQGVGQRLRSQRVRLPDLQTYRLLQQSTRNALIDAERRRAELETLQRDLEFPEREAEQRLAADSTTRSRPEAERLEAELTELYQRQYEQITELLGAYDTYIAQTAMPLETRVRELIFLTEDYARFIDERVLWIRSAAVVHWSDFADSGRIFIRMFSPEAWTSYWRPIIRGIWSPEVMLAAIAALLLLLLRYRLRRRVRTLGQRMRSIRTATIGTTMQALAMTVLLALPLPMLLLALSLSAHEVSRESAALAALPLDAVPAALASGFLRAGGLLFLLLLLWHLCLPEGLGERHFGWKPGTMNLIRRHLRWFIPLIVTLAFLTTTLFFVGDAIARDALGRQLFILQSVLTAVFLYKVLNPKTGVLHDFVRRSSGGWVERLSTIWFPLLYLFPIGLAVAAMAGFYFTAMQLDVRLTDTINALLIIGLLYELLRTWLVIVQRRRGYEHAKQKRSAILSAMRASTGTAPPATAGGEE